MNIKEQIRAEIERRKKELPEQDAHTTVGADSIRMAARYDEILAFLDALPEQPVEGPEENLKKEISRTYFDGSVADTSNMDHNDYEGIARYFAEWQKAQDQKTIELAEDHAMLAGMNKMEQQMMDGAVETQILTTSFINLPKEYLHRNGIQAGDKVRVIVIKKE